jgi:CheY-like chemotaxis protein
MHTAIPGTQDMPTPSSNLLGESIPPIVLLVEQDRDTLDMYSAFFEMSGMWVATSTVPQEALAAVDELQPDIVVAGVGGDGDRSGIHLVQTLKQGELTARIPVIVLSGRGMDDLSVDCREIADICLEKPVLPDQLLDSINQLLARSRVLRQRGTDAMATAQRLSAKSSELLSRGQSIRERIDSARDCPQCGRPLEWIERGRIGGTEFDYYRWCGKGCGLFCYDGDARKWVKLA